MVSQFVLGISNWHFVRDKGSDRSKQLTCTPGDIQIYIKLSSDVFRSENSESGKSDFAFDRNSACFSYATLISLIRSDDFQSLCRSVKEKYEAKEGKLEGPHEEIDLEAEISAAVSPPERSSTTSNLRPPEPEKKARKAKKRLMFEESPVNSESEEPLADSGKSGPGRKKSASHGLSVE